MAVKTWVGGGGVAGVAGKWSESAGWSPSGVPGVTSDIRFTVTSGNLELAAAGKCRDIDFSGFTGTFTHKVGAALSLGTTTAPPEGIALKLVAGMTYSGGTEAEILFVATSAAGVQKVFCGGKTLGIMAVEKGGSVKLEDEHKAAKVQLLEGTLDTNGQTCEWDFTCTGEAVRVLKLGASLVKLTGSGNTWQVSGSNFTLEAGTSTLELTSMSGGTFMGGGKTYYNLTLAGENNAVNNVKTIQSSNTFHTLALNCANTASPSGVQIEKGTTQTIENLTTTAKSGKPLKLKIDVGEVSPPKLSKASGNVSVDWLEITNVETNNAVSWYAGANSTLTGATSFWKKEAPSGKTIFEGSATINGGGAILDTGLKVATGLAALVAGGQLAMSGLKIAIGTATIAAGGRVSLAGVKLSSGTAVLTGGGKLAATGTRMVQGAAILAGGGRLTTAGLKIATSSAVVLGGGRIAATTRASFVGTATIRGGGRIVVVVPEVPKPAVLIFSGAGDSPTISSGAGDQRMVFSGAGDRPVVYANAGDSE